MKLGYCNGKWIYPKKELMKVKWSKTEIHRYVDRNGIPKGK